MAGREHALDESERVRWTHSLSRTGERARSVLYIVALAVVVIFGLLQVTVVIVPLLLALILAAAISPVVTWLRHHGWPSGLATGASFIALVAAFGGVLVAVVLAIQAQWASLVDQAGERTGDLWSTLKSSPLPITDQTLDKAQESLRGMLASGQTGDKALAGAAMVSELTTGFILMAVILFFFLKDGRAMWAFCIQKLRGRQLAKVRVAGIRAMAVLGGYVRGTAIVATIDAVLIGACLLILQVPLALPLTVLIFLGAFVPILGATVTGVLAAVVALLGVGPVAAVIVAIVVIVVNQLEGNLLQPLVMGRTLQIHPLVVLLALATGAVIAGILGAILAVPLTAAAWAALQVWAGVPASDAGKSGLVGGRG
ncbi:AI-2E family transporter [Arthrobacter sp. JSM 101049]|uniref:AI-2E family transporter n=1 Tax=Arthrobacter sp. JSM 101049 TaxID=929097 RepID=UPI00356B55A9